MCLSKYIHLTLLPNLAHHAGEPSPSAGRAVGAAQACAFGTLRPVVLAELAVLVGDPLSGGALAAHVMDKRPLVLPGRCVAMIGGLVHVELLGTTAAGGRPSARYRAGRLVISQGPGVRALHRRPRVAGRPVRRALGRCPVRWQQPPRRGPGAPSPRR